mgnify:CR=1 FL=1
MTYNQLVDVATNDEIEQTIQTLETQLALEKGDVDEDTLRSRVGREFDAFGRHGWYPRFYPYGNQFIWPVDNLRSPDYGYCTFRGGSNLVVCYCFRAQPPPSIPS